MKVTPKTTPDTTQALENAKSPRRATKENAGVSSKISEAQKNSASSVEISENARMLQKAVETVGSSEAFRADRVAELKDKIREGSYQMDSEKIADRLVDEHFFSNFGKNNL